MGFLAKQTQIVRENTSCSRDAFLEALNSYSEFGGDNSVADSKREIAAFFANVAHETGRMISLSHK